jgi:acyl-CoA oxidase
MFMTGLRLLGTDKQYAKYEAGCRDYSVIGCYCQTELGHGSDVQHLETTATYSPAEQTFTLCTPCVSATKWWPGDMGVLANHALVFAQLLVAGVHHGVQPFLIRIRD